MLLRGWEVLGGSLGWEGEKDGDEDGNDGEDGRA